MMVIIDDMGYCCDCKNYRHGKEDDLCERNNRKCGYLVQGLHCYEANEPSEKDVANLPTKVCNICGKALPLNMFRKTIKTSDGYTAICKNCKVHDTHKRIRRKKYELE